MNSGSRIISKRSNVTLRDSSSSNKLFYIKTRRPLINVNDHSVSIRTVHDETQTTKKLPRIQQTTRKLLPTGNSTHPLPLSPSSTCDSLERKLSRTGKSLPSPLWLSTSFYIILPCHAVNGSYLYQHGRGFRTPHSALRVKCGGPGF